MTTVFLTGASGQLGQAVAGELLARGFEVAALVRGAAFPQGCRPVLGSLEKLGEVAHEIARADAVIHLASARSNQREEVIAKDVLGTARLLDAWRRGNFVYASSQTVYGIPQGPLTETAPLQPVVWYDLGKIYNELQIAMAAAEGARGAGVSLRMAVLFGPVAKSKNAPQFHEMIYEACVRGNRFLLESEAALEGYGTSFIGDRDLARAMADSLKIAESGPYNVAGPFCTWKELIATIDRFAGTRSRFVFRAGAQPEAGEFRLPQSRSYVDSKKFEAATSFRAEQGLEELIERFVALRKKAG